MIRLWISSSADYGDFFVFLEDVDGDGESILVSEGGLRAGFHVLRDNDRMIYSATKGIEVLPELPWHGYEETDHVDAPFADGAVVELVIDFAPTSWVFRKGPPRTRLHCLCRLPYVRVAPQTKPKKRPYRRGQRRANHHRASIGRASVLIGATVDPGKEEGKRAFQIGLVQSRRMVLTLPPDLSTIYSREASLLAANAAEVW